MATPTLDEFLGAARTANPGVPDDALKSYWTQAYGQADPATLPTLDTWFAKAKETNPSVPDYALRDYWREEYGSRGALEREPEQPGVLGTLAEGFRQTGRSLEATGRAVLDDRAGVEAIAARPRVQDHALKAFYQAIEDGKPVDPSWLDALGSVGKAIGEHPKGAALSAVEQLPNMGVSMGSMAAGAAGGLALGGPVGAIVGGLAGLFGSNVALESGQKVIERAQDGSFTPEDRTQALTEGVTKGAVITGVDAATLGVTKWITGVTARAVERATQRALVDAGVDTADTAAVLAAKQNPAIVEAVQAAQQRAIAATSTIPTRIAQGTSALALESIGEGVGEYLGEYAATEEGNKVEAVLEALTSLGQSSVEIAGTRALNKAQQRAAMFAKPDVAAVPQHVGVGDQSVSVDDAIARAASMVDEVTPDVLDAAISTEAQDRARTGQGGYEIPSAVEQADQAERLAAIRAERMRLGLPIAEDITQQEKRPAIEPTMLPDAEPTAVPVIEQPVVATKPPVSLDEQPSVIEQERARIVAERAQADPQAPSEPLPTRTPARAADAPLVSTSSIASAPSAEELQVLASLRGQELPNLTTMGWRERQQIADVLKELPLVSPDKMPRVPESQAVEIPRGELPPTQNAELLARAEKAQADMDIAGDERGGRTFLDTHGQGSTQEVIGYKSSTADWYKEATTGERALSRARVETALRKIIQDNGLDTGKDVLRIKQLLLEDREFERSPFAPQNEVEWIRLISRALMPQNATEKTAASVVPEAPRTAVDDERVRLQAERQSSLRGPLDAAQGVRTTGLPARAPYVWSTRDHAAVKAHEDYRAAKSGDIHAAIRLVRDMVNPRTVEEVANRFPGAKFVAPYTLDEAGANMIPRALAAHYANSAKGSVAGDIVQVTRAGRTASDPMERMLKRPQFAGHVAKGGQYVLVDDVVTMGGTLAELSNYIHSQGGTVLGAVSLTNATRTGTLDVSPRRQELLRGRFGPTITDLFGVEPNALTGPEAGYLGNFRSSDALRARADAARVPRGERDTPGRLSVGADRRLASDTGAPTEPAETPLTEPVEKSPTAIIAQALRQAADQIAKSGDVPRVAEPSKDYTPAAPVFFSQAIKTVEQKMPARATVQQVRGILSPANGVKPDELKWMGLEDFLAGKETVEKTALLDYLRENQVQIKEVEKSTKDKSARWVQAGAGRYYWGDRKVEIGYRSDEQIMVSADGKEYGPFTSLDEAQDFADKTFHLEDRTRDATKFRNYTFPGGENYRELLLTLPINLRGKRSVEESNLLALRMEFDELDAKMMAVERMTESEVSRRKELADILFGTSERRRASDALKKYPIYHSSHWGEKNILAHARFNDRTGPNGERVLHLEEIQSDWHQAARLGKDVPDAPLRKTWHEFALKRMLRYAAERGYEVVTWTTGAQQASRYDLSKHIDMLTISKSDDAGPYSIVGRKRGSDVFSRHGLNSQDLDEIIGKELADKARAQELARQTYSGLDLKVGGEGMAGFYDRILPDFMKKYGKRWGASVGMTKIDVNGTPTAVHAVTITDTMRRSVLTDGQALFENTTTYALRDGEDPQRNRELASSALSALARAGDGVSATSGAVDRVGRYDGAVKTVALGISPDLKSGRAVSLTGYRVTSARDLATLAEVYRDPQVETLRFFYMRGEQIVGHEGVSSRLPASVKVFVGPDGTPMDADAFFAQQTAKMRAFGADGYWILHNHPSGRSAPSREDHRLTASLARGINGFRGHVVIDTGEYSTIELDADGNSRESTHTLDTSKTNAMLAPSIQHPHLGTYIRGSQDIASVAKSLQTPAAYASVIYRASNGVVRAIQEVPVELFKDVQGAKDYFQRTTVAFGSPEVFAYHHDDSLVTPAVHQLIRTGVLRDFVTPRQNAYIAPLPDMVMGRPFSTIDSEWVADQRAGYNEQPDYSVPGVTALDSVIRTLQDEFIDVRRLVDAVKAAKGQVADALNPTLKEELYQGRAAKAVQDFLTDELDPLVKQMQLNRISLEDFDRYLYARHAKEANAYLKGINLDREDNDALSGMTNAEAETILQEAKPVMAKIATRVDAIIAENRRMLVEYGLESSQTVAQWAEQYRHYVPLMREGFEEDGGGTGSGRSVRSSGVKARLGSTRRATNILANVALQRERTISRGEKQKPVVALAGLLATHPNAEIAALVKPIPMTYIDDAGMLHTLPGDTGPYTVPTIRYVDPRTGQVSRRPDPNYKGRDNVVNFRVKGQDYAIVFNEDNERAVQMARSLKSLDTTALNIFARAFAPVTRYISSINTQYNPLFGIRNFIRDIGFASISLSSTPLSGSRSKIVRRTIGNLRGIYQDARAVRRGEHPGSRVAKLWEEFQRTGGQTGYRDLFTGSTDRADAIQAMLDPSSWTKTTLGKFATLGGVLAKPEQFMVSTIGKPLFNWLSDYNLTMENSVRLAVFEVAREQGISSEQSASLAKNITVNFNRKGRITSQMGSLYGFFNASVQGTARVVETMFVPGKVGVLTTVGKRIVAGGMLFGAMQALALALAGYDDEEPPEWQKQRSVIVPLFNEKKTYLSFPMPLGFNVIPSLGRLLVEAMVHGNPGKKAWDFAEAMIDTFSPIGGTSSPLQLVTPSALDPVAALYENKDWTGRTIYKENRDSLKPTPGHIRVKEHATPVGLWLSQAINYATGGTAYQPGAISPTPDAIDYLMRQATGGVGREIERAQVTASSALTGETLPTYKVPGFGQFVGSAGDDTAVRSKFYRNIEALNQHELEIVGRQRHRGDVMGYLAEHPEARLVESANQLERRIHDLQKTKRELLDSGGSKERIRLIEQSITAQMARLNEQVQRMSR